MGSLIQDAKEFMVHDIAPKLNHTLRGNFQVVLVGLYRWHAEVRIQLINGNREVIKYWPNIVVRIGAQATVDSVDSQMTLVPNAPPVKANFAARVVGINKEHTEAEIEIRLIDKNRNVLTSIGTETRQIGGTITLNGLEVIINILPKDTFQ